MEISQNLLSVIGETHLLRLCPSEFHVYAVCDSLHHRLLLQNVQHTVSTGEGVEQIIGQA